MPKKPTKIEKPEKRHFGKMSRQMARGRASKSVAQGRIKIKDVASNCMVSQTTVRRWIENGQLRAIRLPSGHYRINQVDYRRFLEDCEIEPGKGALRSKSLKERG
jgi:excisionase family DNA binding protein